MSESTIVESPGGVTYHCVVGHEIPGGELERLTEVVTLDAGARIRICREHGAPIAETKVGTDSHAG